MVAIPPRARSRSTRPRRILQLSTLLTLLLLVPLLGSAIPTVEAKRTGYFPLKPVMGKRKAGAAVDAGSPASAGAKADTLARRQPLAGAQDTAADAASSTTPTAPASTPTANAKLQPRATARLGRRKKKDNIPKEKKDYSSFLCPGGSIACPIPGSAGDAKALENQLNSLADWFRIGFECSEVESDVENCGACTSLGQGCVWRGAIQRS